MDDCEIDGVTLAELHEDAGSTPPSTAKSKQKTEDGTTKSPKTQQERTKEKSASAQMAKTHAANMSASKDRFVLGSAAAMSILNLTLLADIIRYESESYMYVPLLVLMSGAIALQIAIGILSLMISNVSGYFNQFKRDRGNCCRYICCGKQTKHDVGKCCKFVFCIKEENSADIQARDATQSEFVVVVPNDLNELHKNPLEPMPIYGRKKPQKPQLRGLQACWYQTFESEVAAVVAKNNIVCLDEMIKSTKAKLTLSQPDVSKDPATDAANEAKEAAPKSSKDTDVDTNKVAIADTCNNTVMTSPDAPKSLSPEVVEKLEKFAESLQKEKAQQLRHVRKFEIDKERVGIYQKGFEAVEEEKFLERKLYWQNIINYIAYSVVVLNAFIAALKPLADSQSDEQST